MHYVRLLTLVVVGVALASTSLNARQTPLPIKQISQIVDAALREVIPPDRALSQATVAERGVRFDFGRTMTAFGYDMDDSTARSRLKLERTVSAGTRELIKDCNQMGTEPCKLLGNSVYLYLSPDSVNASEASVWVHVHWATPFKDRTYFSGFSTHALFRRSKSGNWEFLRSDKGVVY